MKALAAGLLGLALLAPLPGAAQPQAVKSPPAAEAPAAPATPEPPPPYEGQLLRLSEIMGALSFLRDLCHDGDGPAFRDRIGKLLDVEARTPERKEWLAGAFNKGFGDYQLTYRVCTPAARETIARYLDEAARIAREVATRYGG